MKQDSKFEALADFIVDRRHPLLVVLILITAVMVWQALGIRPERSFKSSIAQNSVAWETYRKFLDIFGNEEYIVIAIKSDKTVQDPSLLRRIREVTRDFERLANVEDVISISNMVLFRMKNGKFGAFPLVERQEGRLTLPSREEIEKLRHSLPVMDLLVSKNLRTVGILVKVSEKIRFDPGPIRKILGGINTILHKHLPKGSDFRVVGASVLRNAVQRYSIQTAIIFGILGALVSVLVSIYIFKSARVALITFTVMGIAVIWITGLVALVNIRVNFVNSVAFGLISVVTLATVIHIVTHFNERLHASGDRVEGSREALRIVTRPSLMCALTTAAGFASITISPIPVVRELGLLMALGVLFSFVAAIIVTPSLLIVMRPVSEKVYQSMTGDYVATALDRIEHLVFHHHKTCVVIALLLLAAMIMGAPLVRSDTQLLRLLKKSSHELKDLRFVEENLAHTQSIELMVEDGKNAFKKPQVWKKVEEMERRLLKIPGVERTDSLLTVLEYLDGLLSGPRPDRKALFSNQALIPELIGLMSLDFQGREILSRYLDQGFSRIRVSLRIHASGSRPLGEIIGEIRKTAMEAMAGTASVAVTGELVVFEAESGSLVRTQTRSLILAVSCITLLLMIQLGSVSLGTLSLVPNAFPLAAIFGIMGWTGLRLDFITVFAATISIGISVDDTIHYLTQFKRALGAGKKNEGVAECLRKAHRVSGKALVSTTAVISLGLLMMLFSPFRPMTTFGLLGSFAMIIALIGDLVFMPSFILSFPFVRKVIARHKGWSPEG
ncbi:MAG: MMPL family transporter [Deltaproteobacteria bacterium]